MIYVWTDPADVDAIARDLADSFGLQPQSEPVNFYGRGEARLFHRAEPAVSIALVVPVDGSSLAPVSYVNFHHTYLELIEA